MIIDLSDAIWLEDVHLVSFEELTVHCGLSAHELQQLVDLGALPAQTEDARFEAAMIDVLRRLNRLKQDFELDLNAMCISLTLLRKIHRLEQQLKDPR